MELPCFSFLESLSPIPCPFEGAYYFDYKDDMSSFCEADMSYAQPCAGGHKYMLNFTHCSPLDAIWFSGYDFTYHLMLMIRMILQYEKRREIRPFENATKSNNTIEWHGFRIIEPHAAGT